MSAATDRRNSGRLAVLAALAVPGGLRGYRRQWLGADLVAGISVCVVMIPSVIAYAELAGLAPVHGLYAALAGLVGYALLASSRHVIAGPDAAISLLVAGAIAAAGASGGAVDGGERVDPARAAALAGATALLGGGMMLLAAALRAGVVADFLSKPVLVGYMAGAALILVSTQLGKLFGIPLASRDFLGLIAELLRRLGETHWLTLSLGAGLIATQALLRWLAPKVPGALVVFVAAIALSALFNLEGRGVAVIGSIDRGLPVPRLPAISLQDLDALLPAAIGIALLTFPEGILLARAFAARNGTSVVPNRELAALATANLAAGMFQGFSVGASQSRTTVNDAAGGKTQLSSLVAAGALVLFLVFLTPILARLPMVALASILVYAGANLIEVKGFAVLYRLSRLGFALAIAVAAGVLLVGVVPGILVGVLASILYLMSRLARPMDAVLHELPSTGRYHDLGDSSEAPTVPGLIAYRFYAPLLFANAEHFVERVRSLIARSPTPVRWFLLDAQAIWDVDATAAEAIARLTRELEAAGVEFKIARANRPLRAKLERLGLKARIGEESFFPSVHRAVEAFKAQSGAASGGTSS